MKVALAIFAIVSLAACASSGHRELWQPDKPQGPYTMRSRGLTLGGRYHHHFKTYVVTKEVGAAQPGASPATKPAPGAAPAMPSTPAPPPAPMPPSAIEPPPLPPAPVGG